MKKSLIPALACLLSGCFLGDRVSFLPAQTAVADGKICVSVDEEHVPTPEKILRASVWSYEAQADVYEKNLVTKTLMLDARRCAPVFDDFHFAPGKTYSAAVDTTSHRYITRGFSVVTTGEDVAVQDHD
ncbi:hypothetical protein SMC30_002571 [Cronobacter dublinensis]|nr:hypothetical protein [Cronobacter dublinensis]